MGVQDALKERLFRAYFTEGASIADTATLARLGEEVGLDGPKCAEILRDGTYGTEVRGDEAEARRLGISGVPFFVIDGQYGISGAQQSETILQVLDEAWSRSHALSTLTGDGAVCDDEHCENPSLTKLIVSLSWRAYFRLDWLLSDSRNVQRQAHVSSRLTPDR